MITGITFGAYDLFHRGHINLLRNAKAQCDKLIVVVSSANRISQYKHKEPIFSDSDRLEIVSACKYVDECVLNHGNPNDLNSYFQYVKQFNADKWFVGSDWQGTEKFNKIKDSLENCQLIFLPHTDGISTTDIVKQIQNITQK